MSAGLKLLNNEKEVDMICAESEIWENLITMPRYFKELQVVMLKTKC